MCPGPQETGISSPANPFETIRAFCVISKIMKNTITSNKTVTLNCKITWYLQLSLSSSDPPEAYGKAYRPHFYLNNPEPEIHQLRNKIWKLIDVQVWMFQVLLKFTHIWFFGRESARAHRQKARFRKVAHIKWHRTTKCPLPVRHITFQKLLPVPRNLASRNWCAKNRHPSSCLTNQNRLSWHGDYGPKVDFQVSNLDGRSCDDDSSQHQILFVEKTCVLHAPSAIFEKKYWLLKIGYSLISQKSQTCVILSVKYLSMFYNIIKQFSTRDVFHYHKNICWSTDHLVATINTKTMQHQHNALLNICHSSLCSPWKVIKRMTGFFKKIWHRIGDFKNNLCKMSW